METVDDEFIDASLDFVGRAKAGQAVLRLAQHDPDAHVHAPATGAPPARGRTGEEDIYGSGLIEHDMQVGAVLDALKRHGVLDDTMIVYSTDNGAEHSGRDMAARPRSAAKR